MSHVNILNQKKLFLLWHVICWDILRYIVLSMLYFLVLDVYTLIFDSLHSPKVFEVEKNYNANNSSKQLLHEVMNMNL